MDSAAFSVSATSEQLIVHDSSTEDYAESHYPSLVLHSLPEYLHYMEHNTLLKLGNKISDKIFDFSTITPESIEYLTTLLNTYSNDKDINSTLLAIFTPTNNTYLIKELAFTLSSQSFMSALSLLQRIYEIEVSQSVPNQTIISFIQYLTISPIYLLDTFSKRFNELYLNYNSFEHFFDNELSEYLANYSFSVKDFSNAIPSLECEMNKLKYILSPLSYLFTIYPNVQQAEFLKYSLSKYAHIQIDFTSIVHLREIFAQIDNSYELLNYIEKTPKIATNPYDLKRQTNDLIKTRGVNLDGSLQSAVSIMSLLSKSWDSFSASTALRNKPIPSSNHLLSMSGGSNLADSDIVSVFTGKYNLVPQNYQASNHDLVLELIVDYNNFSQLSDSRKRQVSSFLVNNRQRFNNILENATKTIMNNLKNNLNTNQIISAFRLSQSMPNYVNSNVQQRLGFSNDMQTLANSLSNSMKTKNIKSFSDAIDFIIHNYIPLVKQFAHKCKNSYSSINLSSVINSFNTNNTLKIFGAVMTLPDTSEEPITNTITETKFIEKPVYITQTIPSYSSYQFTPSLQGGSSIDDLVNNLIDSQKKFNLQYEQIYRNIITELNKVVFQNINATDYHKLFEACNQFNNIMIKDARTTLYLSGYYGARDYNNMYTKAVSNTIESVRALGMNEFGNILNVLESLKKLLLDSRKHMIDLRNIYISANKHSAELFLVAANRMKIPCKLTREDFIAFNDAISRLHEQIKLKNNKSDLTIKEDIKEYIDKIQSRDKIIKSHYTDLISAKAMEYNMKLSNNRNDAIARDIEISLLEQKRDALLYLNQVVDKCFSEQRMKNIKAAITNEQIQIIENAYTAFKNLKTNTEFDKTVKKFNEVFKERRNLGMIYKLIKYMKKLVSISGYFKFVEQLYKELRIFENTQFDWNQFINNITNLMVISSIVVEPVYTYNFNTAVHGAAAVMSNTKEYSKSEFIHIIAMTFEKYCQSFGQNGNKEYPINSGYLFMLDILNDFYNNSKNDIGLYSYLCDTVTSFANDVINTGGNLIPFNNFITSNGLNEEKFKIRQYEMIGGGAALPLITSGGFIKSMANQYISLQLVGGNTTAFNSLAVAALGYNAALGGGAVNVHASGVAGVSGNPALSYRQIYLNILFTCFRKLALNYNLDYNNLNKLPYYVRNMLYYFERLYRLQNADEADISGGNMSVNSAETFELARELQNYLENNIQPKITQYYQLYSNLYQSTNLLESELIKYTFENTLLNPVSKINNYWTIRYEGTLDLPVNLSTLLTGGSQLNNNSHLLGSSVFDMKTLYNNANSTVIPEAVPFYICALSVCQFYIDKYAFSNNSIDYNKNINIKQLNLHIPKISPLYPIYNMFYNQKLNKESLTLSQLSVIVGIFNELWMRTQGDAATKLNKAIDYLFSELNSSLIFTSELQAQLIKNSQQLSTEHTNLIDTNLTDIMTKIKEIMNNNIIPSFSNTDQQAIEFEKILNKAYNSVKKASDSNRLAVLKGLIVKNDNSNDMFMDYYKFMELVVMPILITCESYSNIFKLFNIHLLKYDFQLNKEINLEKCLMFYPDIYSEINTDHEIYQATVGAAGASAVSAGQIQGYTYDTVWNVVKDIKNNKRGYLKTSLMGNPAISTWNNYLLTNALAELHVTKKFKLPKFWLVMDENTYPDNPVLKIQNTTTDYWNTNANFIFKQLYPLLQARTMADYYNQVMLEFHEDFNNIIHNFITYPYISDKVAQKISVSFKQMFKFNEVIHDENNTKIVKLSDEFEKYLLAKPEYENTIKQLAKINVDKQDLYIYPPSIDKIYLPAISNLGNVLPALQVSVENVNGSRIDGIASYVSYASAGKSLKRSIIPYHWVDWVVLMLARCDIINCCLPYKLLLMLKENAYLSQLLIPYSNNRKEFDVENTATSIYNKELNPITRNIITRSEFAINTEKSDYSLLSSSWIASLISITPYLINTLFAVKQSIKPHVEYDGVNVNQEINTLIEILTLFYDDIQNFAPYMGFMSDALQITSSSEKPHLFAEALSFLIKNRINDLFAKDFIKLNWAEPYFFNHLDSLTFPAYKNKNIFEWHDKFVPEILHNGTFKASFDISTKQMAKCLWSGLISKSITYTSEINNVYKHLDETLLKSINIMFECDTDIIQSFCDKVVNYYTKTININNESYKMTGGVSHLSGGSLTVEYTKEFKRDAPIDISEFLEGIAVVETAAQASFEENEDQITFGKTHFTKVTLNSKNTGLQWLDDFIADSNAYISAVKKHDIGQIHKLSTNFKFLNENKKESFQEYTRNLSQLHIHNENLEFIHNLHLEETVMNGLKLVEKIHPGLYNPMKQNITETLNKFKTIMKNTFNDLQINPTKTPFYSAAADADNAAKAKNKRSEAIYHKYAATANNGCRMSINIKSSGYVNDHDCIIENNTVALAAAGPNGVSVSADINAADNKITFEGNLNPNISTYVTHNNTTGVDLEAIIGGCVIPRTIRNGAANRAKYIDGAACSPQSVGTEDLYHKNIIYKGFLDRLVFITKLGVELAYCVGSLIAKLGEAYTADNTILNCHTQMNLLLSRFMNNFWNLSRGIGYPENEKTKLLSTNPEDYQHICATTDPNIAAHVFQNMFIRNIVIRLSGLLRKNVNFDRTTELRMENLLNDDSEINIAANNNVQIAVQDRGQNVCNLTTVIANGDAAGNGNNNDCVEHSYTDAWKLNNIGNFGFSVNNAAQGKWGAYGQTTASAVFAPYIHYSKHNIDDVWDKKIPSFGLSNARAANVFTWGGVGTTGGGGVANGAAACFNKQIFAANDNIATIAAAEGMLVPSHEHSGFGNAAADLVFGYLNHDRTSNVSMIDLMKEEIEAILDLISLLSMPIFQGTSKSIFDNLAFTMIESNTDITNSFFYLTHSNINDLNAGPNLIDITAGNLQYNNANANISQNPDSTIAGLKSVSSKFTSFIENEKCADNAKIWDKVSLDPKRTYLNADAASLDIKSAGGGHGNDYLDLNIGPIGFIEKAGADLLYPYSVVAANINANDVKEVYHSIHNSIENLKTKGLFISGYDNFILSNLNKTGDADADHAISEVIVKLALTNLLLMRGVIKSNLNNITAEPDSSKIFQDFDAKLILACMPSIIYNSYLSLGSAGTLQSFLRATNAIDTYENNHMGLQNTNCAVICDNGGGVTGVLNASTAGLKATIGAAYSQSIINYLLLNIYQKRLKNILYPFIKKLIDNLPAASDLSAGTNYYSKLESLYDNILYDNTKNNLILTEGANLDRLTNNYLLNTNINYDVTGIGKYPFAKYTGIVYNDINDPYSYISFGYLCEDALNYKFKINGTNNTSLNKTIATIINTNITLSRVAMNASGGFYQTKQIDQYWEHLAFLNILNNFTNHLVFGSNAYAANTTGETNRYDIKLGTNIAETYLRMGDTAIQVNDVTNNTQLFKVYGSKLSGGVVPEFKSKFYVNVKEDIIDIAALLATNVSTKAFYQSNLSHQLYPSKTNPADFLPPEFYAKFYTLYNYSNIASLNTTNLTNRDFANLVLSNYNISYVIKPRYYNLFNEVDITQIFNNKKLEKYTNNSKRGTTLNEVELSAEYDTITKSLVGAGNYDILIDDATCKVNAGNSINHFGVNSAALTNSNDTVYGARFKFNDKFYEYITDSIDALNTGIDIDGKHKLIKSSVVAESRINSFKNNYRIIKPVTRKMINIDERMLSNIFTKTYIQQNILSPQYDIYNATLNLPLVGDIDFNFTQGMNLNINDETAYIVNYAGPNIDSNPGFGGGAAIAGHEQLIDYTASIQAKQNNSYFINNTVSYYSPVNAISSNEDLDRLNKTEIFTSNLYNFFNEMLREEIINITNVAAKAEDFGFANITQYNKLSGGKATLHLLNQFYNIDYDSMSLNENTQLQSAYNLENVNLDLLQYTSGYKLFKYAFGQDIRNNKIDKDRIFAYTVNYFHKNIFNFDSIYGNICFPSIILNSIGYESFIKRLSNQINNLPNIETNQNAEMSYLKQYLFNYVKDEKISSDFAFNPKYQIMNETIHSADNKYVPIREKYLSYAIINDLIKNNFNNAPVFNESHCIWFGNSYSSPSVNNLYLGNILNSMTYINKNAWNNAYYENNSLLKAKNNETAIKELYPFLTSNMMNNIRHIDCCSTYIYSVFSLLRHTSMYDLENQKDISYFKVEPADPLSIQ